MDCAIYARVSTTDQNCEMQLRELREYTKRRGWKIVGEYVDTGWSGSKANRPELQRLMADAAEAKFACVLVWKIDRFGRSVLHLSQHLQTLTSYGVRFIATTQALDTDQSNPTARLMLHILAAVAEFEREMIRERVKTGINAAKHRGKCLGRPKAVFDKSKVRAMSDGGMSVRAIAKKLKLGIATVHRCLKVG
jgi:putative DNA-invertase from lambdoid prophage Rac